jgi:hypothetical protein
MIFPTGQKRSHIQAGCLSAPLCWKPEGAREGSVFLRPKRAVLSKFTPSNGIRDIQVELEICNKDPPDGCRFYGGRPISALPMWPASNLRYQNPGFYWADGIRASSLRQECDVFRSRSSSRETSQGVRFPSPAEAFIGNVLEHAAQALSSLSARVSLKSPPLGCAEAGREFHLKTARSCRYGSTLSSARSRRTSSSNKKQPDGAKPAWSRHVVATGLTLPPAPHSTQLSVLSSWVREFYGKNTRRKR